MFWLFLYISLYPEPLYLFQGIYLVSNEILEVLADFFFFFLGK